MLCKFCGLVGLTLILINLDWVSIENLNLNRMQAVASSCKYVGQISKIQDGSVERKRLGGQWQKIVINTKLCHGDILRTTSNHGKKATVKIKCNAPYNPEKSLSADQITGVTNVCSPSFANLRRRGAGTR